MGSRVGYCVRRQEWRSHIIRKQWISSIEEGVTAMWEILGGNPYHDGQVTRDDLSKSRAFAACVVAFYEAPFNTIEDNTNCDICDNGLIEIDITDYKVWKIRHIEIGDREDWGSELSVTEIAEMRVEGFKWIINEDTRVYLGEGLF